MTGVQDVAKHYAKSGLADAIRRGIEASGKTIGTVTIDDLAPVDEFHIGGRKASEHFLDKLGFAPDMHVLDVGCGLGGPARFAATRYRCQVEGVDLTPDFVATGNELSRWTGLHDRVKAQTASALSLPFADGAFDGAYMLHVGMNIADKRPLCAEVARVLRKGARFGIYDIMRTGDGELTFPMPWAASAATSAVAPLSEYRAALTAAGFRILAEENRREFGIAYFEEVRRRMAAAAAPPPLGPQIVMGPSMTEKIKNLVASLSAGRIAPVEIVAEKA